MTAEIPGSPPPLRYTSSVPDASALSEPFAAFPEDPAHAVPTRRVRSTLLISGLTELRARNLIEAYTKQLDEAARSAILGAVAGVWLSADLAMKHFAAVEALHLSTEVAFSIGAASGARMQNSMLQTVLRMATGAGATPWTILRHYGRLWSRTFEGGGVCITKLGPKDARVAILAHPPSRFVYFRHALCGANSSAARLLARTASVSLESGATSDGMAMRWSWV